MATSIRTAGFVCVLCMSQTILFATVYEVGPTRTYTSPKAVPWASLHGGDTVTIDWKEDPYFEKILITAHGDPGLPIRIIGLPGPDRQLPVLDATGAASSSNAQYPTCTQTPCGPTPCTQDRGLIIFSAAPSDPAGYKPHDIELIGLDLRNARLGNQYTDFSGVVRCYSANAASIFIERGEDITVRNCRIHGSGNGFFVASGNSESLQSRRIVLEESHIFGNGYPQNDHYHNIYTEAIGITFQFNQLEPLVFDSFGSNIKDRSAGTVIRYNTIEGGTRMLDLVDPDSSAGIATIDPSYKQTIVFGNVFVNGSTAQHSPRLIHYGGDTVTTANYRKGTLYFYNNTVVTTIDRAIQWRTILFDFDNNDQISDVRNNILFNHPLTSGAIATELTLLETQGVGRFDVNWISPGWFASRSDLPFQGSISGTERFISNSANDPGFLDLSARNFHLRPDSQCINAGVPLASGVSGSYDVTCQVHSGQSGELRPMAGAIDVGAYEQGPAGIVPKVDGLNSRPDNTTLAWNSLPNAGAYDTVKGNVSLLLTTGGDYNAALLECLDDRGTDTQSIDADNPTVGGAFFYLVRAVSCGQAGSYDDSGVGQIRSADPGIEASNKKCF